MSAVADTYTPRLKDQYEGEIRPRLKEELGLDSIMQVPRLEKITLNMGVGEAKTESKAMDSAIEELTTIAGQRAQVRRARKSIAQFKVREGMPVGARVTLRGAMMYEFLDRLVSIALPRIRDFRGLSLRSLDGRGNFSLGIRERVISGLKSVSKPGRRVYARKDRLPRVLGGMGVAILSTSSGLVTSRTAQERGIGGEVICFIW